MTNQNDPAIAGTMAAHFSSMRTDPSAGPSPTSITRREALQLVVSTPPARGEAVESHLADGFGPPQRPGDTLG